MNCFPNRNGGYLLAPIAVVLAVSFAQQAGARVARSKAAISEAAQVRTERVHLDANNASDLKTQRPIEDFIKAQGMPGPVYFYQTPYAPDLPNYAVGVTSAACPGQFCQYLTSTGPIPAGSRIAVVDYAGLASKYLEKHGYGSVGTKTEGSITQHLLPDGRAETTVVLHTTNALTFVSTWDYSLPSPPESAETNTRIFGSSVSDLLHYPTNRPALADSELVMTFRQDLNKPLPDLVQLFAFGAYPDLELSSFYFSVNATGSLPNGGPAKCRVLQHDVNPTPMLINGVLTSTQDLDAGLLDGGWVSEFVDVTPGT